MKRGQSFILDLMIAVVLMTIAALLIGNFIFSQPKVPQVGKDAEALGGAIFSPWPEDWNTTTVVVPGFIVDHRLNASLFDDFRSLTDDEIKDLVGLRSEFYINVSTNGTWWIGTGTPPPEDTVSQHALNRYAIHNGQVATIQIITWDQIEEE